MSMLKAIPVCAALAIAASLSSAAHGQAAKTQPQAAASQTDNSASAHDPNLTPLQTVQYINKVIDQIRIPEGINTGDITTWPGFFAIEQSTGTLWWVRGMKTGDSQWEIRFSSAPVNRLDMNALALGVGVGNYETITLSCKPAPDASALDNCWQNWVASWDDQSPDLKDGDFTGLKFAHAADNPSLPILETQDFSVSPLKKQILLVNGTQKQMIDVEPVKPYWGLEVYLGAANSDTAGRVLRALKYLLKKMPASVTDTDPFGP